MRIKMILFSIALLASAQIACASSRYSAEIGAVQTPQPPPTAAPPQVIVVQQPTPVPASNDNGALIVITVILLAGTMMVSGVAIGYIARGKPQQQQPVIDPQSLTLTTNNYYSAQPALTEADQYRILRDMGHSPEQAMRIMHINAPANARQLPAGK